MGSPTRLPRLLILAFLFVSGGTGLVYELVWSKHLSNVLGNSGQAHAVVLSTFMGGLALGAYLFGRVADRARNPLRLYALLELGIGCYALVFSPVLGGLEELFLKVAPLLPQEARVFPKLVLAGASLLLPTLLMGGTLPALVRHFTGSLSGLRTELARLYAVNSLGAALGVFLAGVHLVPQIGLGRSSLLAAGLNLLVAAGALALSRRSAPPEQLREAEPEWTYPRSAVLAARVGVALSGFTAMLYQITWIRLLAIVLGGSTYAFTLTLTAFILGIGLGSFWLTTRKGDPDALRLFGRLQLALVASVCLALPLYARLPHYFWVAQHGLQRNASTWPVYQALTFAFGCLVLLVPTLLMGASFPAAARAATAKVSELGRQLGGVYLWNTAGTVSGSLLGGLWLMPWLGMEGNFALAVAANLAAGALALYFAPSRPKEVARALWPVAAGLVCAALYLGGASGWSSFVANAGSFRLRGPPHSSHAEFRAAVERDYRQLFYRDDTFATVVVGDALGGPRYLRINGKVDASNGSDLETQILAGHLGPLLHKGAPKRVLLVGAGTAITAGSVLSHPVEHLDMVEISPAVIDAALLFAADNRRALEDPRLEVHIDDAKTFMTLAPEKYDLIVSEPSNPWVSGVSGLFTREFFRAAASHLQEDGILVQWIHTYESSEEILRLVVRTLRDTFPHATTWVGPQDLVLVASRSPLPVDPARIAKRLQRPEVKADLARVGADELVTLLAKQVHSEQGQAEFAGEGPLNTDDLNLLEYRSPVAFFLRKEYVPVQDERRGPDGGARLALRSHLDQHPLTAPQARALWGNFSTYHAPADPLVRAAAERWHALAPEDPGAVLACAKAALAQKDLGAARALLEAELAQARRSPALITAYLELVTQEVWSRRAAFNPVEFTRAEALAGEVLAAGAAEPALAEALAELRRARR